MLTSDQYANKALFDDKVSKRPEMRFDGTKGGTAWKAQMEMYLSGKCPLVMELLKWAEKHGETPVTDENFNTCLSGSSSDLMRQEFLQTSV